MKYLLSIILASLFLFSCERTPTTRVKGTVLEEGTLKPIQNAMVVITQYYSKGVLQGSEEWPIDTIYSNSAGVFEWETEINPRNESYNSPGKFSVDIIKHENYFQVNDSEIRKQGNESAARYTDKIYMEVQMIPHAYLKLDFTNGPEPSTHYCKLFAVQTNVTEELYNEDKSFEFKIPGNRMITYYYTTDINLDTFVIDSFYIGAYETKELSYIY